MEGTVVHSLGPRKLVALLVIIVALFVLFFAIDVKPTRQLRREMKPCNVEERRKWNDISNCPANSTLGEEHIRQQSFYLQLPDSPLLSFIVWDYFLFLSVQLDLGILNVDTLDQLDLHHPATTATFTTTVGYKNFEEAGQDWKPFLHSEAEINLQCKWFPDNTGHLYCNAIPFFELGSVNHDYYLVNTKIGVQFQRNTSRDADLHVRLANAIVGHQAEDFTKAMLALKLVFFPLVLIVLLWYNSRIRKYRAKPAQVERSLIALGVSLATLNFPLEWLIVWVALPSIHLLNDIRLVFFYAVFFHFFTLWIEDNQAEKPEKVWRLCGSRLSTSELAMPFLVLMMLIFHLAIRIPELENPFFVLKQAVESRKAILAFVCTVGTFFGIYSLVQVKSTVIGMKLVLGKYQGGVQVALLASLAVNLLVAVLTVVHFFVANFHWYFMKYEVLEMSESGALYFGIYGAWNLYAVVLMILFAPNVHMQVSDPQAGIDLGMEEDAKIVDAGMATPIWYEDSL